MAWPAWGCHIFFFFFRDICCCFLGLANPQTLSSPSCLRHHGSGSRYDRGVGVALHKTLDIPFDGVDTRASLTCVLLLERRLLQQPIVHSRTSKRRLSFMGLKEKQSNHNCFHAIKVGNYPRLLSVSLGNACSIVHLE